MNNHEPTQEELDTAIQEVIERDKMQQAVELASLFVNLSDQKRIEFGEALVEMAEKKGEVKK